ncbi:hypothetical protein [Azohydromonas aeria]|uniref:hypothetical protein n=1 Tax=Azohydromonas aeria TaxID=2590212 RepID=UPI0012FA830C|nr:hypothetical protein [Azohydromonas aeria]
MELTTTYAAWQLAAKKMVADACMVEYRKANDGKKRHVPYRIPEWCMPLLNAVERDDEEETKRIMHAVRIGCLTLV